MSQLPIWNTPLGSLGETSEEDFFSFQLDYSNPTLTSITPVIIAGSLPQGLTINSTGLISGTVVDVQIPFVYNFVLRLTNAYGSVDRNFFITIDDIAPTWTDPANLGTVPFYSLFQFQFFVTDPGGTIQTFEKISGTFPPGLQLSANGMLSGIVDLVATNTTYNFTVRSFLNGTKFIDKTFSFTVTITGNRPPLWNDPAGLIGNISFNLPFSFQFSAGDPDHNPLTYTATSLPPGYSLSTSGLLTGTLTSGAVTLYSFSVSVNDGFSFTSRVFSLNANNEVLFPITWITPSGSIGSIKEGDKSLLSVRAMSSARYTRYELSSGTLPLGLTLDPNSGDIWGLAQQQTSTDEIFNFTITAYNTTSTSARTFSINLVDAYVAGATRVTAQLYGHDRLLWNDLFTSDQIPYADLYRQGDDQYGLIETPAILIVENLNNPTPDAVYTTLQDVRRDYLTLGKVQVIKAVQNDAVVYEVIYRTVYDDANTAALEITIPSSNITVEPGSIDNIRTRLLTLGSSGGTDNLPLYYTSEQTIGDPTTITGYFAMIPFAYVQPGTGQSIADKINAADVQKKKLYLRRVRIDRVIISPAADSSFVTRQILYDNIF